MNCRTQQLICDSSILWPGVQSERRPFRSASSAAVTVQQTQLRNTRSATCVGHSVFPTCPPGISSANRTYLCSSEPLIGVCDVTVRGKPASQTVNITSCPAQVKAKITNYLCKRQGVRRPCFACWTVRSRSERLKMVCPILSSSNISLCITGRKIKMCEYLLCLGLANVHTSCPIELRILMLVFTAVSTSFVSYLLPRR